MVYFSLESEPSSDGKAWRLIPVRPILPFPLEILIETLAPAFASPGVRRLVVAPPDQMLEEALLQIGLEKVNDSENDSDQVWFELKNLPVHPFTHDSMEYFQYCRARERYMTDISTGLAPLQKVRRPTVVPSPIQTVRKEDSFGTLCALRRSADSFSRNGASLRRKDVETILQDSYYFRPDGHQPCATAGGFQAVGVYVLASDLSNTDSGVFSIDQVSREWKQVRTGFSNSDIRAMSFDQDWVDACSVWVAAYIQLHDSAAKYGARAYRFSLLAAGAVLHQAALSGTSLGLRSRILGGFDDLAVNLYCGLHDRDDAMVAGLIGFGAG